MIHQLGGHGDKLAGHLQIHLLPLFQPRHDTGRSIREMEISCISILFLPSRIQNQIQTAPQSPPVAPLPRVCTTFSSLKTGFSKFDHLNKNQIWHSSAVNAQRMALSSALLPMPSTDQHQQHQHAVALIAHQQFVLPDPAGTTASTLEPSSGGMGTRLNSPRPTDRDRRSHQEVENHLSLAEMRRGRPASGIAPAISSTKAPAGSWIPARPAP